MRIGAAAFFCLLSAVRAASATAAPETQGVSSRAVLEWIDTVERDLDAIHSFVLVRHGNIVAEGWWAPYARERPHMLYSLSKSFTATAVGFAVDEGRLKLDDTVASFFPGKLPGAPGANLTRMRVRDLLCMGSGHQDDTLPALRNAPDGDWVSIFLAQPVQHEPGTFFRYNTGATYMLSAILQQVTGQTLLDYLTPRLFAPLDIRDATWETCPRGINTGGYGLKIRTRDIAALGQLYLQNGAWQGKTLIPKSWIDQATTQQIANGTNPDSDWAQGYGFQFWRCRHNAYRGDGAFGQYCLVMPEQDAVLAITGGLGDMQKALDIVWQRLLPAMAAEPLPADPGNQKKLTDRLAALALRPVSGERASPRAATVVGKPFALDPNENGLETLTLEQDGDGVISLRLRNGHGDQRIACGFGRWTNGEIVFEKDLTRPLGATHGRQPVAASGAWLSPDVYMAQVYFIETPYRLTLKLQFKDDRLYLDMAYNVSFDKKAWHLIGR
jgi:CubicO group peptidase (beta-lactamase class C family)